MVTLSRLKTQKCVIDLRRIAVAEQTLDEALQRVDDLLYRVAHGQSGRPLPQVRSTVSSSFTSLHRFQLNSLLIRIASHLGLVKD